MPLMKLVDLSSQISQELSTASANGMVSGATREMHLQVTTEKDELLVVVVPLQQGPSQGGSYGTPTWGPASQQDRSENYHDPYRPGTVMNDENGVPNVWVQDQGFVVASSIPGATVESGAAVSAAHKAIDALVAAFQGKK